MTLHPAVNRISSQQRPAWMKYHKETRQLMKSNEKSCVHRLRANIEEHLPQLESADVDAEEADPRANIGRT
ncbi:hypothetical protein AZE42_08317 [Rhizopogon vesiculosus]|uniref:Uncharacterized protein n=1 Tax=Rhizopogon vesiculosus TaxID=180088 RepID=A0A1J8R771_9AGAM|nr:hypothetical protein AZE42_08317 [Rhizopogon vesiculosus]